MTVTYDQSYNTLRHAHLGLIRDVLLQQNARKIDLVAPASALRMLIADDGPFLRVRTDEQHIDEGGVTPIAGLYRPSPIFDEGISDKLGIPIGYLRRMRTEHLMLYTQNIDGWWTKDPDRQFLVRLFRGDEEESGVARALLSDRFRVVDNLDVLMTVLDGIRNAGVEVKVHSADLSDRRMTVRVVCEEISALAPTLLKGYRSPFDGASGDDNPVVFSGFRFSNSEVGGGACTITPELLVQVCSNGMTISKDALREVHLGGKMQAGAINWSDETQQRNLELIKSQTRDAVTQFLDIDYITRVIGDIEAKAEVALSTHRVEEQVKDVTKGAGFTEAQQQDILDYFIQSGQMTKGGIYNAATAYARTVEDPDEAHVVDLRAAAILAL